MLKLKCKRINIDDLGLSDGVTSSLVELSKEAKQVGIIISTSLMLVPMYIDNIRIDMEKDIKKLLKHGVEIGLHLDLTSLFLDDRYNFSRYGKTGLDGFDYYVGNIPPKGRLSHIDLFRELYREGIDEKSANLMYEEIRVQINDMFTIANKLGFNVSHIDSHHNVLFLLNRHIPLFKGKIIKIIRAEYRKVYGHPIAVEELGKLRIRYSERDEPELNCSEVTREEAIRMLKENNSICLHTSLSKSSADSYCGSLEFRYNEHMELCELLKSLK